MFVASAGATVMEGYRPDAGSIGRLTLQGQEGGMAGDGSRAKLAARPADEGQWSTKRCIWKQLGGVRGEAVERNRAISEADGCRSLHLKLF